jgi:hypothetical protein
VLLFLAASALSASAVLIVERPTIRYLHPFGLVVLLVLGPLLIGWVPRCQSATVSPLAGKD